jgi:hypothetical protein
MAAATDTFSAWLAQAHVPGHRLTPEQRGAVLAAYRFRQSRGADSYSTRLLTHFLLHCGTGLKVAQLARLAGVSCPTASRQQRLSSKQAVQQAHHRLHGRPYGKLLPRYAGPVAGFARLTGGRRCPSRHTVGGWRRHVSWYDIEAFCRRTSPWELLTGQVVSVSYDEHTIPRWTRKFRIRKGYVTTRNKYMRCEELFYCFDLDRGRSLAVRATPGDWGRLDLAVPLARQTLEHGLPDYLHALFDAGAGQSDAGVRALWDLAQGVFPASLHESSRLIC